MWELLQSRKDLILPVGVVASVLVILIPLPTFLMDLFLAANITAAVIILLTTIYVKTPLEFSIFPTVLLATTLARLVLNIATTRLILTSGTSSNTSAAGGVIESFGQFVAGDQIAVGIIIFAIIVVIQFIVITKGATRISEVTARFALDGMPGRQMAIDADLSAGHIDPKEAQRRRKEVLQQADFYGAMDGASKFVRGDAIAGIVITLINIAGGFAIGLSQGMGFAEAGSVFTLLTIGDGLVSQIPAFLISVAAGMLVTRNQDKTNLPQEFLKQLFSRPEALTVAGLFLTSLIFTNLPSIPLLTIGGSCIGLAFLLNNKEKLANETVKKQAQIQNEQEAKKKTEDRIENYLAIDPIELEISLSLIRLADPERGGELLPRITGLRQMVASDLGIVLPKVRIRDNMQLKENRYNIKIANNPVAGGLVYPDKMLAVNSGTTSGDIAGIDAIDPAYGQPAKWIEEASRDFAESRGYTAVDPVSVMITHLEKVVRRYADEILTRDATQHLIEEVKETTPAVVTELIPGVMKISEVQQVLQGLLREEISIRQLSTILETLGDYATKTKDIVLLVEYVRHRLARTICNKYRDDENVLPVTTLDPALEDRIAAGIKHTEKGIEITMPPNMIGKLCSAISEQVENLVRLGMSPVVVCSPQIRPGLKLMTSAHLPNLVVISYNEVTRDTRLDSHGVVTDIVKEMTPGRSK
jgi:flagellar biosynthesis protein FlhA